jgi:hypothetical protein
MSIFDGLEGDLGAELDDLGIDDDIDGSIEGSLGDVAAVDDSGTAAIALPDPFGGSSLSPQTQGVLDSTAAMMSDASTTYAEVAAAEGLAPDLPAPGAEQASAFVDSAMNADAEQAQRMMAFDQGETYVQEIKNDIAEREAEVQQAEETSGALAESELLAWQADRAVQAAASAVEEGERP